MTGETIIVIGAIGYGVAAIAFMVWFASRDCQFFQRTTDPDDDQLIQEVREIMHGKSLASVPHTGLPLNPTPDRWVQ